MEFIKKLHEQTEELVIFAAPGYPNCIGIRSADPVITHTTHEDIVNLIHGEIFYDNGEDLIEIKDIEYIPNLDPRLVKIHLKSQVIIDGHIIQIDLGKYEYDCYSEGTNRVFLTVHRVHLS